MRYTPGRGRQVTGTAASQLDPLTRPPLELLPDTLVELLVECDTLRDRCSTAEARRNELFDDVRDTEAQQADDAAAALAARAGKPIPKPKAVPALAEARASAERALTAQRTALAEATQECLKEQWRVRHDAMDPRPDLLAELIPAAERLAADLEHAVAEVAALDWLNGCGYFTAAQVWPVAIDTDLRRQGLSVDNTNPFPARDLIIGAVTQALTTEE
ncbi:hypothetical protein [Nocardia sp. NPDC050175]|uniref:hypothetical protein n=1 Tax=Nocardia sp. NPDC050175 TaxID=3364317 RepID=UPI0037AADA70